MVMMECGNEEKGRLEEVKEDCKRKKEL